MNITDGLAKVEAYRNPYNEWAAKNRYSCRWGEKVQAGDSYITKTKGGSIITQSVCKFVCPFDGTVSSTNIWEADRPQSQCVKIVPYPVVNEITLTERLTLLDQKLDDVLSKLNQVQDKLRKLREA